jgi:hypothetical protein
MPKTATKNATNGNGDYATFLEKKTQLSGNFGFKPIWIPDSLFDFQAFIVDRQIRKGRGSTFSDCGTGKTPMQLVCAENIARKTNKRVLVITPLAVSDQTVREGAKFGIECIRSKTGVLPKSKIVITNYESLHKFDWKDFVGVVADESSAIKSFDGARKAEVTEFMRQLKYRSLWTATPSPNDFIELGTSSEALGELGYMDMLSRFFKNDQNTTHPTSGRGRFERGTLTQNKWRFKRHAEGPFWQWVCSWAIACRKPSDLGFSDERFILPPLEEEVITVAAETLMDGFLFPMPAVGLKEQRAELKHTLKERCEAAARILCDNKEPGVAWCYLNPEGDLLEKMIPGSRQIHGRMSDDEKEEIFNAFASGELRNLITKPKIGAWGLNWAHCALTTFFASHSFEQYYQAVRRFWRFGQARNVRVKLITTEGQRDVLLNLQRKAKLADQMFDNLVGYMHQALHIERPERVISIAEAPSWL